MKLRNWKGSAELVYREPRTSEALKHALDAYLSESKGLHRVIPPERYLLSAMPETDLVGQANTLFSFSRLNLSGDKAWNLADQCARLIVEMPWLVDPRLDRKEDGETEAEHFRAIIRMADGMRPELYDKWLDGLRIVREEYNCDPRNLFHTSERSRTGLISTLCQFKGIAHKIAQMSIGFFDWWSGEFDPELAEFFRELGEAFVPVDMWWMRLFRQWDLFESWSTDSRDHVSWPMSQHVADLCLENGWPYQDLCQAVWHIGSTVCFNKKKGNKHDAAVYCRDSCPMNQYCVCLVPPAYTATGVNRASQNWDNAIPRTRILDEDLIPLPDTEVPRPAKPTVIEIPTLEFMAERARLARGNNKTVQHKLDL